MGGVGSGAPMAQMGQFNYGQQSQPAQPSHGGGHSGKGGGKGRKGGKSGGGGGYGGGGKGEDQEVQQLFADKLQTGLNFDKYDNIPVEVSPNDPSTPPMAMFEHMANIHHSVLANIRRAGYNKPTPVQKYGIPILCAGKDLMACAQTGSGKTATFLLPCVNRLCWEGGAQPQSGVPHNMRKALPSVMVLSPTRELATQIYDEARKFIYQTGLHSAVVYGGAGYGMQFKQLETGCDILVATPGRLMVCLRVQAFGQGKTGLR